MYNVRWLIAGPGLFHADLVILTSKSTFASCQLTRARCRTCLGRTRVNVRGVASDRRLRPTIKFYTSSRVARVPFAVHLIRCTQCNCA